MKSDIRTLLTIAGLCAAAGVLNAQPSAHYVPGVEGIKAASLPGPGMYVRDYNVYYISSSLSDNGGYDADGTHAKAHIYANVPRFIWITDWKLLGGNVGVDVLVPIISTSFAMDQGANRLSDSSFNIGDPCLEFTLSWHGDNYDTAFGYALWFPVGKYDADDMTNAGTGYWAHMITVGGTWYPDAAKKWAASILCRYEMNQGNDDTDVKPGLVLTFEGGISRAIGKNAELGVVGYYQQQVSPDRGPGASDMQDKTLAVGFEVSVFHPSIALGWSLRALQEMDSANRLEGQTICLTVTKPL